MEIQLWREILEPYSLAVDELIVKFEHMISAKRDNGQYSSIERVDGRVKKISSILAKCQKKGISFEDFEENMDDIAGIRIICQFVEDIYDVVSLIRLRSDMRVKREKDYIKNQKDSGYRSYHMIVYYTVETEKGPREIPVEIQIRTLAMNFWATVEHSLQYKYKGNLPESVNERLHKSAEAIVVLDREMSTVREEILDAQASFNYKANRVADILTNIQNLYNIANKQEIVRIQEEFFRVYAMDDMNELSKFARELDLLSESYKAQSLK
ncbi:MAG: GTP pyrophosphokinase family protein [Lachnospiraceae bacterium]|jgi:putative GTP pyrophosphokinase|nr:GTP pyrophosphokinase family protein [Lachnospiraceae bacterium]MBP5249507.1 GTP pyrophosphokinase family protein [Lachnospiraceae bacterium]MBR6358697.1 GTP pyrophosphokinase family protein [Lachnospiraceae bacterium]